MQASPGLHGYEIQKIIACEHLSSRIPNVEDVHTLVHALYFALAKSAIFFQEGGGPKLTYCIL